MKKFDFITIFFLVITIQEIRSYKPCHTDSKINTREIRKTIILNRPVYESLTIFTNIICNNVNLSRGEPLLVDEHAKKATGLIILGKNLNSLPTGVLNNLTRIQELYLNNTNLENIEPEALSKLTYLEVLYLQNNNISLIQIDSFTGLRTLSVLDLSNNSLKILDANIFSNLFHLIHLNLSNNKINAINDRTFLSLQELQTLDLSNNNISTIILGTFANQRVMSHVLLRNNNMKVIPDNLFGNITNLKVIDLNGNNLRNSVMNLMKNGFINSKYSQLNSLPAITKNSTNLVILYLADNRIDSLNSDTFVGLNNLTNLQLQQNNISSIPIGTFRDLINLSILNISSNDLTYFDYGSFTGLSKLTILDISNNKIFNAQIYWFYPLRNLQSFNISGNFISSFDVQKMIMYFPKLSYISLDKNRWPCEWLTNIVHTLKQRNINVLHSSSYKENNVQGIRCLVNSKNIYKKLEMTNNTITYTKSVAMTAQTTTRPLASNESIIKSTQGQKNQTLDITNQIKTSTMTTRTTTPFPTTILSFVSNKSINVTTEIQQLSKSHNHSQEIIPKSRSQDDSVSMQRMEENNKDSFNNNTNLLYEIQALLIFLSAIITLSVILQVIRFRYKYNSLGNSKNHNSHKNNDKILNNNWTTSTSSGPLGFFGKK